MCFEGSTRHKSSGRVEVGTRRWLRWTVPCRAPGLKSSKSLLMVTQLICFICRGRVGVDSFSKAPAVFLGFWCFAGKKDPWKETLGFQLLTSVKHEGGETDSW